MKIELIPMKLHEELNKIPLKYDKEKSDPDMAGSVWMTLVAIFSNLGVLDSGFSLKPFIESRAAQARKGLSGSAVYDMVLGELASNSTARISEMNYAVCTAVLQYFKLRKLMMETVPGNIGHVSMQAAVTKDLKEIAQAITSLVNSTYESPVRRLTDLIVLTHTLVNSEVVGYLKPSFYFIEPANQLVLDEMNRWECNMVSLQDKAGTARAIGESRDL